MLLPLDSIPGEIVRRLCRAADDRADPMRLAVVASIALDGRPNARTLVIRGADDGLGRIWFHTDRRSGKVDELGRAPAVCAVMYDRLDGVQLRLSGTAKVLVDVPVVEAQWTQLGLATRHLYQTDHAPGVRVDRSTVETDPRTRAAIERMDAGDRVGDDTARRNFAVIEMSIESIDWLQSLDIGMRRALLCRDGDWVPVEIGA